MTDHTPPHDLDAERSVLGGMLMSKNAIIDVTGHGVRGGDFYRPAHEVIFDAITHLHTRGEPVDAITVADHLTQAGTIDKVGGPLYLHTLLASTPTAANAGYYARIVTEKATLRRLNAFGTRVAQLTTGDDDTTDLPNLVQTLRAELDHAAGPGTITGGRLVGDTIDTTLDTLDKPSPAIATPWGDLNDLLHGWRPGALYVIGARPGVGKTIAGIEAAIGLSRHGYVAFASLEMPEAELHMRLIAHQAEVPINRMDSRTLTEADWTKIAKHRASLADLRISIDDRGTISTTDIRSHARTVARRGPLAGIVVDYLQLMSTPRGQEKKPRHEVVGGFSRDLKLLAKEMGCPVIALSQLNRASEQRQDKRPSLADLRESGSVEQDSDVVLLLHENEDDETDLSVLVAKNRHGARGSVRLIRRGWFSRLDNHAWTPTHTIGRN